MLHINPNLIKIRKAKKKYYDSMSELIQKRIDNLTKKPSDALKKIQDIQPYIDYFNTWINLETILIGRPDVLYYKSILLGSDIESSKELKACVEYVFNYKWFCGKKKSKYDAYDLAHSLKINTCPYCNRNYTNTIITVDKEKFCRPAFDHYFPESKHPLLAISFYNLIPSCTTCNSGRKGADDVRLDTHLNPYVAEQTNDIVFSYQYSSHTLSDLEVVTKCLSVKERKSLELFGIKEVYNTHIDELRDMIRMRTYFTDQYLDILQSNLLDGIIISRKELYRLAFGTEFQSEDFINKPLSKFKNDILKELGIIE